MTRPMRKSMTTFLIGAAFVFCLGIAAAPAAAAARSLPPTPKVVSIYASVLRRINPRMPGWMSQELARRLLVNAAHWHIDANMLAAVVTVESRWRTHAVSDAGAIGLGQLMPDTAATLDVNPRDPGQNLAGAARYLSGLAQRFAHKANRYALTFAAYNAGPYAVEEFGGIPPFYETQNYVARVLDTWHHLQRELRIPRSALLATLSSPVWTAAHGADVDYWLKAR
jgi:soluble lytic murein transglycosylase-like protein